MEDTKKKFLEFVKSKGVAVISTVSPEDQPMSATIYYIVDEKLNFYFMSKNTRKTQNIESNNKVALLIGTANAPVTVQIHGKAERLQGGADFDVKRDELIQDLLHNPFSPPIFEVEGEDYLIFKITPTWIRWFDSREKDGKHGFMQILP